MSGRTFDPNAISTTAYAPVFANFNNVSTAQYGQATICGSYTALSSRHIPVESPSRDSTQPFSGWLTPTLTDLGNPNLSCGPKRKATYTGTYKRTLGTLDVLAGDLADDWENPSAGLVALGAQIESQLKQFRSCWRAEIEASPGGGRTFSEPTLTSAIKGTEATHKALQQSTASLKLWAQTNSLNGKYKLPYLADW